MYYGRKSDFEYDNMTLDVVQNGAIATVDVYVQPQDTGVLWDAYLLKPLFDTNGSIGQIAGCDPLQMPMNRGLEGHSKF